MLARWPIRYKLLFGVALMMLIVAILSFSGIQGVYSYRKLARSISRRANELPEAAKLAQSASDLRASLMRLRRMRDFPSQLYGHEEFIREDFRTEFLAVNQHLSGYRQQLDTPQPEDPRFGDRQKEQETVREIERILQGISELNRDEDWMLDQVRVGLLEDQLEELNNLCRALPSYLHGRMHDFAYEVRGQYRTWIVLTWITSVLAVGTLSVLLWLFHGWIFRPLRVLISASRRVARGEFTHRVQLTTRDEMSELAGAMNEMTTRFQEIRDDLDRQVKERTKEVVRTERLASVGFLAAGVAHEINNPLASIAWSAESLESRMGDFVPSCDLLDEDSDGAVIYKYLRRIQDEAFRCKGITERLLDFSRMGDVERNDTNMHELLLGVIDMVRHLGKYRGKSIECECQEHVLASVNSQEIKQVALNLITNALDSLDSEGGVVHVGLKTDGEFAELLVNDNGCGMSREVLEHLFEPFFTRRRDGQGTGLGLSITWRIINDHGGRIIATSDGPGMGSQFRVLLPLSKESKETHEKRFQAA